MMRPNTFAKEVVELCYCSNRKWCFSLDIINAKPAKSSNMKGEVRVGVGVGGHLRHTGCSAYHMQLQEVGIGRERENITFYSDRLERGGGVWVCAGEGVWVCMG